MTFEENAADREPPQLGGFFIARRLAKDLNGPECLKNNCRAAPTVAL
jgi:hypothetical protein